MGQLVFRNGADIGRFHLFTIFRARSQGHTTTGHLQVVLTRRGIVRIIMMSNRTDTILMSFQLRLRLNNRHNVRTHRLTDGRTHAVRQNGQFFATGARPTQTFHDVHGHTQRLAQQMVPITRFTTVGIVGIQGLQRQRVQRVQFLGLGLHRVKAIDRARPTVEHPLRLLSDNFATGHTARFQRRQATHRVRRVNFTVQRIGVQTVPKLLRRKVQIRVTQLRVVIVNALIQLLQL